MEWWKIGATLGLLLLHLSLVMGLVIVIAWSTVKQTIPRDTLRNKP